MIVFLTNVNKSLPVLMDEIRNYGAISGYKLNSTKTEVMNIGCNIELELKKKYKLKWDQNKIKYLGIIIPNQLEKLYTFNYQALENSLKQDFARWKLLPLTIFEKIAIIQMNVLPRFLFLFQNVPLYLTSLRFKEWEGMLRKFIWDEKKPRVKLKFMQQKRELGGLGLPDLCLYYHASQVKNILVLMNKRMNPKWKLIEINLVDSFTTLIFSRQTMEKVKGLNHCTYHTWKSWKRLNTITKLSQSETVCLREICNDPDFIPNRTDETFNVWETMGITRFHKLFNDNIVTSFENLSKEYNLPRTHFYRYLQVRSYLKKHTMSLQDLHPLVSYILKVYENPSFKKVTGQIYHIINNIKYQSSQIKVTWEKDLGMTITEEEWSLGCKNTFKYTR